MNKEIIKKIINIWDPYGVFGLAPKNEYDDIISTLDDFFRINESEENIKEYLLNQYYSKIARNEEKVNELYDLLLQLSYANKV